MLGLFLLIISVFAFWAKKYSLSLLGYLFFAFDTFFLIPKEYMGASGGNYALLYTIIVGILSFKMPVKRKIPSKIYKAVVIMEVTIFLLCINTMFYYSLGISSVTIYLRELFFLLSFFIIIKVPVKDLKKLVSWMFSITIMLTILYIFQAFTGIIIFQTSYDDPSDLHPVELSGFSLYRVQNSPAWLPLFLVCSYIVKNKILKESLFYKVVLTLGLIVNQSRTWLVSFVISIVYGMRHLKQSRNYLKAVFIIAIFLIIGGELFMTRFVEGDNYGNTVSSQVLSVSSFNVNTASDNIQEGTFIYRLGWCLERLYGIIDSGEIDKYLFGLGMMTEEYAEKIYRFHIGNPSLSGGTVQLFTYDTDYGNIIVRYGFLGGMAIIYFIYQIFSFFYKRRKINSICLAITSIFITLPILSFSSTTFTQMSYYIVIFLLMNIVLEDHKLTDKSLNHIQ